jgi:hypothetical protein
LYNIGSPSRRALTEILRERTRRFATVARQIDAILDFGAQAAAVVGETRPFADFHHCPFIGLVGAHRQRVGCLLHPAADGNCGVDYRGLSHYGGMACRTYFCPSHRRLSHPVKIALRESIDDWYAYGLIVTEVDLLEGFFQLLAQRSAIELDSDTLCQASNRPALSALLRLKSEWPFRRRPDPGSCNYFFADGLYGKPDVVYPWGFDGVSRHDGVLRELQSGFRTVDQLRRAEHLIETRIDELAQRIRSSVASKERQPAEL